jgi:hypothetical protein
VALGLAVLDRLASERLVKLHSLVGSAAILVLRRLGSDPEEDVALKGILALLCEMVSDSNSTARQHTFVWRMM